MPTYALGILSLIKKANHLIKQICYADDISAIGSLVSLCRWWEMIVSLDPAYVYYANSSKTWVLVKEEYIPKAISIFEGPNI